MGEPRRIELMPVAPLAKEKKSEKLRHSIRIKLSLGETTSSTQCMEVSYVELLRNALEKKKEKNNDPDKPVLDPDDPFAGQDDAEHDKLLALAQSFEAKYGPKPGKKKKHVDRIQDLVDLGDGYDETDPFVDNSEAYDEIVPACLTTKLGGFYINTGVLDFREVSDDSDEDFIGPKKKKKKRKIISDSEGEVGEEKKKRGPKRKKFKEDGEKIKKKRKKLSSSSLDGATKKDLLGLKKKRGRPKLKNTSLTVAELLKSQTLPSSQNGVDNGSDSFSEMDINLSQNLGNSKIDSTIDAVVHRSHSPDPEGRSASPHPENAPKLPDSVTPFLENNIDKLKQAARDSEEGKCKFFSPAVNGLLLDIELKARDLPASARQTMYAHLAAFLPCGQQTLMKRARKLRINAQDDALRQPFQKLKDAINRAMPAQLERHVQECLAAAQMRGEKTGDEKTDKDPKDASTESDDEGSRGTEGGGKKRVSGPRKKFQWNQEIINLLCDLVRVKMECKEMSNVRSQSAEEYLKAFLDAEVKPLWPKGWMQTRMLFKESRTAHYKWTYAMVKLKKPVIVTSKPVTSTPVQVSQSGQGLTPLTLPGSAAGSPIVSATPNSSMLDEPIPLNLSGPNFGSPSTPTAVSAAPTLLDYASASYMSAAKGKTVPQATLSMGTTVKASLLTSKSTNIITNPTHSQSIASSLSASFGAKVSSSLASSLSSLKTPATDALKSAVSGFQSRKEPSAAPITSTASFSAQFEKFAQKFHEKTAALIPKPSSTHVASSKPGLPPRSPPASKTTPQVSSISMPSSLSPKAKASSVSSSQQGSPLTGGAHITGANVLQPVPKLKVGDSLGFATSSDLAGKNSKHTSSKAQLQHAQVTSSSTGKQPSGSAGQKPTAVQMQSMDKPRSSDLSQGRTDTAGLFGRITQNLQAASNLDHVAAQGSVSNKKPHQEQVVSLSSTQNLGQNQAEGHRQVSPNSLSSKPSTQRTSPSSTTMHTKASTDSDIMILDEIRARYFPDTDVNVTSNLQVTPGISPPRNTPTQAKSNANHKSGVSSSLHNEKTVKLERPAGPVINLDEIRARYFPEDVKSSNQISLASSTTAQASGQTPGNYSLPSALTSPSQPRSQNQVSTSHSRPATQVSSGLSRQTVQVSSGHSRQTAQVTSGHSRPAAQVSSGLSQQTVQVSSGHSRQATLVSSGHSRQATTVSSGHSRQATTVSSGHSRQSTQASSSQSHSSNTVTTSHSKSSNLAVSSHSRPSNQSTTSHSRHAVVLSHLSNPSSSSKAPQSTVVTTGASQNHGQHKTVSSQMRKMIAKQQNRQSSQPTTSHTLQSSLATSSVASHSNPFYGQKPVTTLKFADRDGIMMRVDSSTSAFAAPSIAASSSPVSTTGMFLAPVSSSLSAAHAMGAVGSSYQNVQLSDLALDSSSHIRVSSHSSPGMQQLLRSPESLLAGNALYGHSSPHSTHSLQHNQNTQSLCPTLHGSSPIRVLHPTVLPYGHPYTDQSHNQHRY